MIQRQLYLTKLKEFIDKPFVKVITGIRRSGKSSILKLLIDELQANGISSEQIIYINFESFSFSHINKAQDLYETVRTRLITRQRSYVILDEIQELEQWEKAVNSFLVDFDVDIYITGSNSRLLSSELATLLTGRYVEFHIYPLSFSEYIHFRQVDISDGAKKYQAFGHFLRTGGFPVLHTAEYSFQAAYQIVYDIYSSVILRDTIRRNNIRDVELLERVVKYVFENIGNKISGKNIADYFKSQQRKIDINTVYNYLHALENAFIIHRTPRFDVKGKEILKTQEKYFLADPALLYAVMGYKDRVISGVLENIVMLELKRKGYEVFTGKFRQLEIDFIGTKGNMLVYIQVAYLLPEKSTIDREFEPLLKIQDNHPKYVVTMDQYWKDNVEGVKHYHIADFLLLDDYL